MSKKKDPAGDVPTTGHSWDGIEEYDNPMPRWWLYTFYACIVWAIGYSIAYPAWPLIKGATPGLLGYSTRAQVVDEIQRFTDANAAIDTQLSTADLTTIHDNAELNQYAINAGAAVYRTWCVQCHGSGAAGAVGYPNLLDDDWLWGGSIEDIQFSIKHGIRNEVSAEARFSEMPAFGEILESEQIVSVVNFVQSLSGEPQDAALVADGATLFEENCATCHGAEGLGDREQGAPNLADAVWLYGGDYETLVATVTNSRYGVMPPWAASDGGRLTESQVNAVATYVHQLGGGE